MKKGSTKKVAPAAKYGPVKAGKTSHSSSTLPKHPPWSRKSWDAKTSAEVLIVLILVGVAVFLIYWGASGRFSSSSSAAAGGLGSTSYNIAVPTGLTNYVPLMYDYSDLVNPSTPATLQNAQSGCQKFCTAAGYNVGAWTTTCNAGQFPYVQAVSPPGSFTVMSQCVWMYMTAINQTASQDVILFFCPTSITTICMQAWYNPPTDMGMRMSTSGNTLLEEGPGGSGSPNPIGSVTNDGLGTWIHLCITFDGSSMNVYIDGAAWNTPTGTTSGTSGRVTPTLGGPPNLSTGPAGGFVGQLLYWRVYNTTLTASQVTAIWTAEKSFTNSLGLPTSTLTC